MSTDDPMPESDENEAEVAPENEEFSLEELSNAYAKVLHEHQADGVTGDIKTADTSSDSEKTNAEALLDFAANKPRRRKQKSLEKVDAEDNAGCAVSPESILEAILFVGAPKDVKLTARKIAAVMRDISPKEVKKMATELNKKYKSEDTAYRVDMEGGNYSLKLAEDLLPLQNRFFGRDRATKLSQGAIDVLAVVAYNQPVTKERVERIRAKPSGPLLNQLVKRNLIEVQRTETKPVKRIYTTSDRFLDLFGLEDLNDLPQTSTVSDLEELTD